MLKKKLNNMRKTGLLILLIGFFTGIKAQDFEVAPVVLNFSLDPGESETRKINITNHSSEKNTFELKIYDFEKTPDGKKQTLPAGTSSHSLADWLNVNPAMIELNPNETKSVEVTLSVPKGETGTKWAMIAVQQVKEQEFSEIDKKLAAGVIVVPRIAVVVTQSSKSNTNWAGKIENIQQVSTEKDSIRLFKARVINTGDKIINGKVYLAVANINTGEEKEYPPVRVKLFPGESKEVTLQLKDELEPGRYAVAAIFDYAPNKALEGTQMIMDVK
ncbi:MAG: hypothetical protein D6707_05430 [Bacteroidetes bacterium]|nr:MAG: hypothetical protein D6707_05430 [Bacteroidota bacterium]